MPGPAPAARPRLSGAGFNQGFGEVNEHLDQQAMQQAVQQKSLGQQATQSSATPSAQPPAASVPAPAPREVSPGQEIKWFGQDIVRGLTSFFDLNALLQIDPVQDDPQTQAQKQQFHQRYQRLTQEEQQYVQQKYRQEMEKKQQEEQEKQLREQQRQQAEAQELVMPSSPQKGPQGPGGSGKQRAVNKLQQDRKILSGPASVN